ncbi:type II secretion system protein J [Chloroflexota bacterium]
MKLGERGYTYIELLIAITIMALASTAAGAAIFQVLRNTERNNDHMTAVRQVQNAGYWISRDAQMALSVNVTDNMTPPDFLGLNWTEWDDDGDPIYHSVKYSFEALTDGIGKLKRTYSIAGASEDTMVAQYIYYDPNDTDNTSDTSYQNSVLTVRLMAVLEEFVETREYRIKRRAGL